MTSPEPQPRRFDLTRAASAWSEFRHTKLYDFAAGLPLTAWFGLDIVHQIKFIEEHLKRVRLDMLNAVETISLLGKFVALIFLVTLLVLMIVRRPAKARAQGIAPRLSAFMGTNLTLAIVWLPAQPISFTLSVLSLVLMAGGLAFSVYSVLHLGRSFSIMAEARRLVVDGPYARIRHPLYLGEAVATVGFTLQFLSAFALLILSLQLAFQLIRIRNEEAVLARAFPEYGDYRMRTARLVPGLY